MLANKADLAADEAAEVEVFRELTGLNYRGFMPPLYPGPGSPRP